MKLPLIKCYTVFTKGGGGQLCGVTILLASGLRLGKKSSSGILLPPKEGQDSCNLFPKNTWLLIEELSILQLKRRTALASKKTSL